MTIEDEDTIRPVGGMIVIQEALGGCCRSTVYGLLKNDPSFPPPWMRGNRLLWFLDEIEAWKASQPRRQYAAREA